MRLSRRQHGFVDYGVAALELALSSLLPAGVRARRLLRASGLSAALLGALTDYDLGLLRVVPMRVHLALDGIFAATFLAAPAALRDEGTSVRIALTMLGLGGAVAAATTDPDA